MDRIQRKIVVRPCPTTISFYPEGFFDDHFAVTLKPFSGEGGIRTRETLLAFTHFPGVPLQPLEHLSLSACLRLLLNWKAPQRYNNICILPNCHAFSSCLGRLWQTLLGRLCEVGSMCLVEGGCGPVLVSARTSTTHSSQPLLLRAVTSTGHFIDQYWLHFPSLERVGIVDE